MYKQLFSSRKEFGNNVHLLAPYEAPIKLVQLKVFHFRFLWQWTLNIAPYLHKIFNDGDEWWHRYTLRNRKDVSGHFTWLDSLPLTVSTLCTFYSTACSQECLPPGLVMKKYQNRTTCELRHIFCPIALFCDQHLIFLKQLEECFQSSFQNFFTNLISTNSPTNLVFMKSTTYRSKKNRNYILTHFLKKRNV